jgi:hypothetical protein
MIRIRILIDTPDGRQLESGMEVDLEKTSLPPDHYMEAMLEATRRQFQELVEQARAPQEV